MSTLCPVYGRPELFDSGILSWLISVTLSVIGLWLLFRVGWYYAVAGFFALAFPAEAICRILWEWPDVSSRPAYKLLRQLYVVMAILVLAVWFWWGWKGLR